LALFSIVMAGQDDGSKAKTDAKLHLVPIEIDEIERARPKRKSRRVNVWRLLQIFGAACLAMVMLTHVAERFDLFPRTHTEHGAREPQASSAVREFHKGDSPADPSDTH
jgi:hypothetical protein